MSYWNMNVAIDSFTSVFIGHTSADGRLLSFQDNTDSVKKEKLHVSLDELNVNLIFIKLFNESREQDILPKLEHIICTYNNLQNI